MEIILNGIRCTSPDEAERVAGSAVADFLRAWCDDSNYVMGHTSGSTGTPKEIRLYKEDMRASARLTNDFFGIDSHTSMLLCLSPTYIAGKMMLVRAMEAGATLYVEPASSQPLVHAKTAIDFAAMVPMQVHTLLQSAEGRVRLASIRRLIIGGAAVSSDMEKALTTLPTLCYATYGMTETVSHVALRRLGEALTTFTAIGDVTFTTDDRDCLVIHAPQLRCKTFVTNDVVRLESDNRFTWLGRYDHVINSGGVKIQPEQVERIIAPLLDKRFFLTSRPDDRLGERLVLVVEDSPWPAERIHALQEQIRAILDNPYHLPREIHFMPRFHETTTGKLLRHVE
ncbi:MAG: AMP-binding protein [Coprobacter sp.]|nr:AMP-binding protein [Coprobacter sp.]